MGVGWGGWEGEGEGEPNNKLATLFFCVSRFHEATHMLFFAGHDYNFTCFHLIHPVPLMFLLLILFRSLTKRRSKRRM